jgi:hypothetical protein
VYQNLTYSSKHVDSISDSVYNVSYHTSRKGARWWRAEESGVRTGIKCYQLSGDNNEIHQGCKANQALDEAAAQRVVINSSQSNKLIVTYWLPVPVDKDLYLHFNIDADLPEKT